MIILLLIAHFIGDFVLQKDSWARGKSSNDWILLKHVLTYSFVLFVFLLWLFEPAKAAELAFINGSLHWWTDYFTSRATKKLWAQGRVHDFFVVIGLDQMLHYIILFESVGLL